MIENNNEPGEFAASGVAKETAIITYRSWRYLRLIKCGKIFVFKELIEHLNQ